MAHIVCDDFFCLMFDACSVRCSSCCVLVQCGCTPRTLHWVVFSLKFTSALPTELMAHNFFANFFGLMPLPIDALPVPSIPSVPGPYNKSTTTKFAQISFKRNKNGWAARIRT